MKPLYCFKLDTETNQIEKITIASYREVRNSCRTFYKWETPRINKTDKHYTVTSDKLDKFANNKVFTFNDSLEDCVDVMRKDALAKEQKAKKELESRQNMVKLLSTLEV